MIAGRLPLIFVLIYVWALISTPEARFPLLANIYFSKLIVLAAIIFATLDPKIRFRLDRTSFLIFALYLWFLISYLFSPYKDHVFVQEWLLTYWKHIVLYLLLMSCIKDLDDLRFFFIGVALILLFFQVHAWLDYVRGGSYVWQQGVKRIVGVWSDRGLGSANAFGMMSGFALPFIMFWLKSTPQKKMKVVLSLAIGMVLCSVFFSGTRAAVLTSMVVMVFYAFRRQISVRILATLFLAMFVSVIYLLPGGLKHRYWDLLTLDKGKASTLADEIAIASAKGRMEGLKTGFKLFLTSPILGHGPGASPPAAGDFFADGRVYGQLHSLYGQIISESGFVGTMLFFMLIANYFSQLKRVRRFYSLERRFDMETRMSIENYVYALQALMVFLLFYGLFSHTLYKFYWFLIFGFHSAFISATYHPEHSAKPHKSVPSKGLATNN